MNITSPARLVLAAAVFVDAVAVFWVSRGIYLEPMAARPLITASGHKVADLSDRSAGVESW